MKTNSTDITVIIRAVAVLAILCLFAARSPAQQRIVIKGSNTFGKELAPALTEAYRKDHPNIVFELESKGSGSGFEALLGRQCDIAASSRSPTEDEKRLALSRGIQMSDYLIGFYGVAVIVNAANPIKALSDRQICDVFTGAITNWHDVGGEDAPIRIYIRDKVSGTYLGFQELAMQRKPYAASARTFTRYSDLVDAVKSDRAAIGYSSMNLAEHSGVRALTVNKVQPTAMTVNEGHYPFSRTLRLYTDKNRELNAVREFIGFVRSRAGQNILSEHGFVPIFEERIWSPDL
jgi:phosphate transport system substrate-binding protein